MNFSPSVLSLSLATACLVMTAACGSKSSSEPKMLTRLEQMRMPELPAIPAPATEALPIPPDFAIDGDTVLVKAHCPALNVALPPTYDGQTIWVNRDCNVVYFKPIIAKKLYFTMAAGGLLDACRGGTDRDYDAPAASLQLLDEIGSSLRLASEFEAANQHLVNGPTRVKFEKAPFKAGAEPTYDKKLADSYWEAGPIATLSLTMRGVCVMMADGTAPRDFQFSDIKLSRLIQQSFSLSVIDARLKRTTVWESWGMAIVNR